MRFRKKEEVGKGRGEDRVEKSYQEGERGDNEHILKTCCRWAHWLKFLTIMNLCQLLCNEQGM